MSLLMFGLATNRYAIDRAATRFEAPPVRTAGILAGAPACVAGMSPLSRITDGGRRSDAAELGWAACPSLWNMWIIVVRPSRAIQLRPTDAKTGMLPTAGQPNLHLPSAGRRHGDSRADRRWGRLGHDAQGLYQRLNLARLIPAAFGGAAGRQRSGRRTAENGLTTRLARTFVLRGVRISAAAADRPRPGIDRRGCGPSRSPSPHARSAKLRTFPPTSERSRRMRTSLTNWSSKSLCPKRGSSGTSRCSSV